MEVTRSSSRHLGVYYLELTSFNLRRSSYDLFFQRIVFCDCLVIVILQFHLHVGVSERPARGLFWVNNSDGLYYSVEQIVMEETVFSVI
jgi:hypothetical protein